MRRRGVRTGVAVVALGMRMSVEVEVPVPPADEQAQREEDDERRDGGLGALLHALGQVALGEEDRDSEDDERDPVADAPPRAELGGRPRDPLAAATRRASSSPRCDPGSVAWRRPSSTATRRTTPTEAPSERPAIQSSSPNMSLSFVERARDRFGSDDAGKRRAVITSADDEDERRAHGGQRADDAARRARAVRTSVARGRQRGRSPVIVAASPRLNATMSASPSPIRCSAIAREEDDERRRTGQEPRCDTDAEDPSRAQRASSCGRGGVVVSCVCGRSWW